MTARSVSSSIPTPITRPMAEVRGRLDDLLAAPLTAAGRRVGAGRAHRSVAAVGADGAVARTLAAHARARLPARRRAMSAADDLARMRQHSDPVEVCSLFVEWVDSTLPDRHQRDELDRRRRSRPPGGDSMRLHRLRLRAFGPFAGEQSIDFEPARRGRAVPARRARPAPESRRCSMRSPSRSTAPARAGVGTAALALRRRRRRARGIAGVLAAGRSSARHPFAGVPASQAAR